MSLQRLTIIFSKTGAARFLSHLDLISTLEFSIRRARLPVALAEGFNPRPRMSVAAALPLGHIGEREILELTLKEPLTPAYVMDRLEAAVPPGIHIVSVEDGQAEAKSAASRLHGTIYRIELPGDVDDLQDRAARLMGRPSLEVVEQRDEKRTRIRDIRPLIVSLEVVSPCILRLHLRFQNGGTARPEQILELLGIPPEGVALIRESIEIL